MANPQLQTFFNNVNAYLDRRDKSDEGIRADLKFYQAKIEELNNLPGSFTDEEQRIVDEVLARLKTGAEKQEATDLERPTPPEA